MSVAILLVLPPKHLALVDQIRDTLEQAGLGDEPLVDTVTNEADAFKNLSDRRYGLVISHIQILQDRRSPLREDEQRGLLLLRAAKERGIEPPGIIIADHVDGDLHRAIMDFVRCELVQGGISLFDEIPKAVRRLFGAQTVGDAQASGHEGASRNEAGLATVEFTFNSGSLTYRIGLSGERCYSTAGNILVEEDFVRRLVKDTELIPLSEYPAWRRLLDHIGESLHEKLAANRKFHREFWTAVTKAGGLEKTRIRFCINKSFYPVAFEALWDRSEGEQALLWMLRAPMTRKLIWQTPARLPPLFHDPTSRTTPLNCLIIEANVEATFPEDPQANLPKITLEILKNVPEECDWLKRLMGGELEEIQPNVKLNEPVRLRAENTPAGKTFKDYVKETLKSRTWHIVHYGGHSYYNDRSGEGYVFFPGRQTERVPVQHFAGWLKETGTRFIYLSSCHSSAYEIALEFAANQVPAILGFRWDLEDDKAADHAKIFYRELLAGSASLELAFLQARKQMYERYETDRIWAAPMMVLQADD